MAAMLEVARRKRIGADVAARRRVRTGGSEGNRRLTGATAAILLVLLAAEGVTLLDFTDVFCDGSSCSPVVGGANVYRDQDHLTVTFVRTLEPQYTEALRRAIDDGVQ